MTDDKKRVAASDDHLITDAQADALAELVWLPSDDEVDIDVDVDVDLDTEAAALTEGDRKALAALGSPTELVDRLIAAAKAKASPTPQADRSTRMASLSTTIPQSTGRPQSPETSLNFDELLQKLRNFENEKLLSWSWDYCKKGIIGRGGQGIVFLTECLNEHNLPKALKVFSPEPYRADVGAYREDMNRMAQVAKLVYHIQVDNLVTLERFGYHDGIFVMIMQWIDGYDLARLLQPSLTEQLHGCVDEERWKHLNDVVFTTPGTVQLSLKPGMAVNIIEKCLRALDALHSHGIVHGDIKPSNIMLDQYGSIRLVDIGSAFEVSAPPQFHTWTPRYAPPEFFERGEWTPQSDLASLGYVLIELLIGRPAIVSSKIGSDSTRTTEAAMDRTLLEEKRRLPERLNELLPAKAQESKQLMELCRRLIDPDPQKRFANAEQALEGLNGTYQFQKTLVKMNLAAYYAQEIKRWITDVKKALK